MHIVLYAQSIPGPSCHKHDVVRRLNFNLPVVIDIRKPISWHFINHPVTRIQEHIPHNYIIADTNEHA